MYAGPIVVVGYYARDYGNPTDRGHRLMAQAVARALTGSYLVCPAAPAASIDALVPSDLSGVHADALTCALEYGMLGGFPDGPVDANRSITRGQAATFVRAFLELGTGTVLEEPDERPFTDIADTTHEQAISALQLAGLVDGPSDGTFAPDAALTRPQFAKLLLGALDVLDDPTTPGSLAVPADTVMFDDVIGITFQSEIQALAGAGIVHGQADRTFGLGELTRGQAASLLFRVADRAATDGAWTPIVPA